MEVYGVHDFDPVSIFECGQCFRWQRQRDGTYAGVAGGRWAKLSFSDGVLRIYGASRRDFQDFWYTYFDLGRDYGELKKRLGGIDLFLDAALEYGAGIRILNQDLFETFISFILSSNNNIPRIRNCVEQTATCCGSLLPNRQYGFPEARQLAAVGEEKLKRDVRAGYRCDYIKKSAAMFFSHPLQREELAKMPLADARKALCKYAGVGPKVADCILLFSGTRQDVFPVDTWVKKVMEELYFQRPASLGEIQWFAATHFGGLAGFAQQYLFYYAREHMEMLRNMIR